MTESVAVAVPQRQSLRGFAPRNAKELAWLANEVVKSGMFKVGNRTMIGAEAFVLMMKGSELGLTPMQSLAEISLIKGKPFVSKDVITARIVRSPRCRHWDPSDADDKHCTIKFQVQGEDVTQLSTSIDNIPKRYFAPSSTGEPSNWMLIPEDMLFAWTARRVARRWFPEALLDIGDANAIDETRVIDVRAVEREVGNDNGVYGQHVNCGGNLFLHASSTGGAYLQCSKCGERSSPPQEIRDAIRGRAEEFSIAAQNHLEPGEREPTQAEKLEFEPEVALAAEEPPPSDEDAPEEVMPDDGGRVETSEPELGTVPKADVVEPAVEEPEGATVKAAGSSTYAAKFRTAMQLAVNAHITATRGKQGDAKREVRDGLLDAGWDGRPGVADFVSKLDDEHLAALLKRWQLPTPAIAE